MVSSHAGDDKWEQLYKDRSKFLMNTKWNGKNFSLEKFTGMHRSSFVQLEEASDHVNFQLPTEHTRVGYLIDNIHNPDPDLRAACASIRLNTNGMRSDFEAAVAFLLPVDPYSKKRGQDNKNPNVSDAHALKNKSTSKTGVDFRWYKPVEYKLLNKEQRAELYEWQKSKEGQATTSKQKTSSGYKAKPSAKKKLQAKITALKAKIKAQESELTTEELAACIASATESTKKQVSLPSTPESGPHVAAALALEGILKRKRAASAAE